MILNTRRLFCRLLRTLEIETVCDVGSMDGSDALLFRRILPTASIIAFEPNPRNLALMEADEELRRQSIHIMPLAASDNASMSPFFIVEANYVAGEDPFRRGLSSLHKRSDGSRLKEVVEVRTARLDAVLRSKFLVDRPIALWIDTEGVAFEVVSGASGVLQSTRILHVEVETKPIIGAKQKLFTDVEKTLTSAGFILFATDQPRHALQFNALYLSVDALRTNGTEILRYAKRAQLCRCISNTLLPLIPGRLRLLLGLHLTETRCQ